MPRDEGGWSYDEGMDGVEGGNGSGNNGGEKGGEKGGGKGNRVYLHAFYAASDPHYSGRVTTPTLWDRHARTVVNNESSEILRMFNTQFKAHGAGGPDLYPQALRGEIDRVNEAVYRHINNGVYRCGFAQGQAAYEEAFRGMFETWDMLEALLGRHRYLVGHHITEADVRLFPTLVRFDPVYFSHFKCNLRRIADYPNLSNYLRDLYQLPQFGSTVNIEQYKRGYYGNSPRLNPSGIIPLGPELLLHHPHDRATRAYGD